MEDVVIEIRSLQDGKEVSYLLTDGRLSQIESDVLLEFDGSDLYGQKGATFSMRITGDKRVSLALENGDDSEFTLERGVKHFRSIGNSSDIHDMLVGIDAQQITSNVGLNGGTADFKYILDYNNHSAVTKEMKVSVRSKNQ